MNDLLAKYRAIARDVDADKELTVEQKLGFYMTLYRSLIHDVEENEYLKIIIMLLAFLVGIMFGSELR